ncbi:MAG: nitroreductase family protein [Gudongella sp.]|jgi:nitroreductase|nr:nitroreductase family protein [Gudongella sp.]
MDLFNSISKRKACREYINEPLTTVELEEVVEAIKSFEPLFPNIPLNYRFATEIKGMFHVKAPHYLVISGNGEEGEQENAGFIGQQLMLWLNARGLGGVWLGASRDASENRESSDIIVIAFGKVEGSPNRELSEFKRKDISEITNDPEDKGIKAIHLAPSGINIQPWYFEKRDGKLLVYRQILKPPMSLVYKLTRVDMGIALCHYAVASTHYGADFYFQVGKSTTEKKGYKFFGYANIID